MKAKPAPRPVPLRDRDPRTGRFTRSMRGSGFVVYGNPMAGKTALITWLLATGELDWAASPTGDLGAAHQGADHDERAATNDGTIRTTEPKRS
jgi:hypothetical protein